MKVYVDTRFERKSVLVVDHWNKLAEDIVKAVSLSESEGLSDKA